MGRPHTRPPVIKLAKKRKPTSEEMDVFATQIPPQFWQVRRFIDYFYLLRHVYDGWSFYPTHPREYVIVASRLIDRYGKEDLKRAIESLFVFRKQIVNHNARGLEILTNGDFRMLGSTALSWMLEKGLHLIRTQEAKEELPAYKRIPYEQWTPREHEAFRKAIAQGGFIYATGSAT